MMEHSPALNLIAARIAGERRSLPEVRELFSKLPQSLRVANSGEFKLASFGLNEICYAYFSPSATYWLVFSNKVDGHEISGYKVNAMTLLSAKSSPRDVTDPSVKSRIYTEINSDMIISLIRKQFKTEVAVARVASEKPEFSNAKDAPKKFVVGDQVFKRVPTDHIGDYASYESSKYNVAIHFVRTANSRPVVTVSRCKEDFHIQRFLPNGKGQSPSTVAPIYNFPILVEDFQDLVGLLIERIKL